MNPLERLGVAFKQFSMAWSTTGRYTWWGSSRSRIDYRGEVGDARGNAIVQGCVLWVCRTFPEAPLRVSRLNRDGDATPIPNHPLKQLLDTPNPYYSGELLWASTMADWMITGNAYWLKVRSRMGRPVELWWVPSYQMEPKWPDDGSAYLTHYDYTPNAVPIPIPTEDVVHFRYLMLDPQNIRKGISPLASLFRELYTDQEAAQYTSVSLKNVGVPPMIVSPAHEDARPSQEELEEISNKVQVKTTGDRRGETMVFGRPTNVQVLGFNPQQMDVKALRRIPEERVSAIFGTPAVVVGLGAGLDRSTFSNMAEAREAAYESNILPSQRILAAELRTQLLPDFGDPTTLRVDFDLSQVRVLQADENDVNARARENMLAGGITLNEFREKVGEAPLPDGDVLYLPGTVTPTDPAELLAEPEPLPTMTVEEVQEDVPPAALPPGKLRRLPARGRKAASAEQSIARLRDRLIPRAEREILKFFRNQADRAAGVLEDLPKATRPLMPDPDEFLEQDAERLRIVLERVYQLALEKTHGVVEDALGVVFDLDDPTTRAFLLEAGVNIRRIHEETLAQVRQSLREGQAEGESLSQLAARLRGLPAFSQARANTVARTELALATNTAAVYSYRASGLVVGVLVRDGDYDVACQQMDGRTFRLEDAPPALQHPNCLRALLPITDVAELEAAA